MCKKYQFWDHHVIGPIATNNYYLSNNAEEAVLLDPGGPEAPRIVHELKNRNIEIIAILVTHGHFDHLSWATEVQKETEGAKVYLHKDEKHTYEDFHRVASRYGYILDLREPDRWIHDGQKLKLAGITFEVMHTPGHSPGSVTYLLKDQKEAFTGDTLFKQSIGRTDLQYSNPKDMEVSLKLLMQELPKVDKQTKILPGHGETSSIDVELQSNPFLLALKMGRSIFY
jgi:hydroxyacylglutathione hydrolase